MRTGGARCVGGWGMVGAALVVLAGALLLQAAAQALQRQAAQLDPNEARLGATEDRATLAGAVMVAGLLAFLVFAVVFLVGSARARRAGRIERAPGIGAGVASLVVLGLLLFTLVAPQGPLMTTLATASGGNDHAVSIQTFNGTLTAATVHGTPTKEDAYAVQVPSPRGAIRMHMGSGGGPATVYAVAILTDASGREIARTLAQPDSIVDVPVATYAGGLTLHVQVQDGGAGEVKYLVGVSFAPA